MNGGGPGRASAQGKHAAPAMIHGSNSCQTNHIPHAAMHGWRRTSQPDAGLGQRGRQRLLRSNGLVRARRDGKMVFYSPDDAHIRVLLDITREHVLHGPEGLGAAGRGGAA